MGLLQGMPRGFYKLVLSGVAMFHSWRFAITKMLSVRHASLRYLPSGINSLHVTAPRGDTAVWGFEPVDNPISHLRDLTL